MPFTPRAKKVLELSLREALQLGHNYIGTEHILLGLIREGEGVAAQVLQKLGADLGRVRQQVIEILSATRADGPIGTGPSTLGDGRRSESDVPDEELRAVLTQALERLASLDREVTALPEPGRGHPGAVVRSRRRSGEPTRRRAASRPLHDVQAAEVPHQVAHHVGVGDRVDDGRHAGPGRLAARVRARAGSPRGT